MLLTTTPADVLSQSECEHLWQAYRTTRARSLAFAGAFSTEDWMLQSMVEASPIKWHLAHTTWFFETFLLQHYDPDYASPDPAFAVLFNSYYQQVGDQHARGRRGLLSRPSAEEVRAYRAHVDCAMEALIAGATPDIAHHVRLGIAHEEQHQELMVTDVKHGLADNPLHPVIFQDRCVPSGDTPEPLTWISNPGDEVHIGTDRKTLFDNEVPRHPVRLTPHALASRLVTAGEWQDFMADGGYHTSSLWLAEGWDWVQAERIEAPLYWEHHDGLWHRISLAGLIPVSAAEPVFHINFYEAAAFAEWSGYRLPTEAEWEAAAVNSAGPEGAFLDVSKSPEPQGAQPGEGLAQMFGDCWEWTGSAYRPYPGYRTPPGAVGEYNGKFMVNQMVLRGGSVATPPGHVTARYRNFFHAWARWQFSGLRLARDL